MEVVRREVRLNRLFTARDFERAFERFVQTYNVPPLVARCSPDVLDRYCGLHAATFDRDLHFRGVPLRAAVLPAGTIIFEGEVDEDRMGDW